MRIDPRVSIVVRALAQQKAVPTDKPAFGEVKRYLATCFQGAEQFAAPFYQRMTSQHWHDRHRRVIRDWRAMAKRYASRAFMRKP